MRSILTFPLPQTGSLSRTEAILTQLVFEHALRIRLKAETASEEPEPPSDPTPDNVSAGSSTLGDRESGDGSTEGIPNASGASTPDAVSKGKQRVLPEEGKKAPTAKPKGGKDLIGKINNLVSTDLAAIVEGRDFLMISKLCFQSSRRLLSRSDAMP